MDIQDTGTKIFLLVIVVVVGLVLTVAVMWSGKSATPATVNINDVQYANSAIIGQESAPITIAFWSDYQCPVCKNFELNTLPQLMEEYVKTGKVRIAFLDFAFLGADSTTAAIYGRAVWKLYPELYEAWRTTMYTAQDQEQDIGFGDVASIDALNATIPGLDAAKIAADVKANTAAYQTAIAADKEEGRKAHLGGTPSFVIGTTLLQGNQAYSVFKATIDPLLP